ncbi:MAG: N-acetylmuramic acid 6-phosphate etherase [Acidaminococcus sp.]|uniref:N-acetylmuramic acid 6-phosphate etherase n=1 Tax=Acidaminococcus intestini TaxID=187327 RepID=A0A943I699_9FIRM|nr:MULTISPECIES: N-acetylmuramic acid 6-phosphate etherase [Acidaminococcus]MBS5520448.1 N-acetylmuramic acid 6-phosphate etherase [Acidaminococcus intestini]MDY2738644.1 N-acetylmuramic acid 6-phosphate etherase [Acidaminococcus sp.]
MLNLEKLSTEARNPASSRIDKLDTLSMMRVMNDEDQKTALAVKAILPDIARAVDVIADRLKTGGRLFYMGSGTSGRLGILDAAECPPTYSTDPELVQGLIAGGKEAIFRAREGAEDSPEEGANDITRHDLTEKDVLVGITASGRTPYVLGGMEEARRRGAFVIGLACSKDPEIARAADLMLICLPGPEVVTGSTRMKAGTVTKMILNMLSTGTMIRLGKVRGNLMIDVKATNEKLKERATRIVMTVTGMDRAAAERALRESGGCARLAVEHWEEARHDS